MIGSLRAAALWFAAAALLPAGALAQTLYAVSVRNYSDAGYRGVEGNLYKVAPGTGATSLLTSLRAGGQTPIGLDGLAMHPVTGVFYGITSPTSAVIPRSLVTVDPESGRVTLVGDLGHAGSDIGFDSGGTLFAWIPDTRQMGAVDLATGAVTPRGRPGERGSSKGGFTVIAGGVALVAATGATGTLDRVDTASGTITIGPPLVGAPFPDLISGLAYSPNGELFAINSNFGTSSSANLVTIDVETGKVTNIGPLPSDTDAIAFGRTIGTPRSSVANELTQWRFPVMVVLFLFAVVFLAAVMWPRKKR
jgi:hypothetical protein